MRAGIPLLPAAVAVLGLVLMIAPSLGEPVVPNEAELTVLSPVSDPKDAVTPHDLPDMVIPPADAGAIVPSPLPAGHPGVDQNHESVSPDMTDKAIVTPDPSTDSLHVAQNDRPVIDHEDRLSPSSSMADLKAAAPIPVLYSPGSDSSQKADDDGVFVPVPSIGSDNVQQSTGHLGDVVDSATVGKIQLSHFTGITEPPFSSRQRCIDCHENSELWSLLPEQGFDQEAGYDKCVFVGRVEGDCGAVIDSYDAVIRFNDREPTEATEQSQGKRTTIMFKNDTPSTIIKPRPEGAHVFLVVSEHGAIDNPELSPVSANRMPAMQEHGWGVVNPTFFNSIHRAQAEAFGVDKAVSTTGFVGFMAMRSMCKQMDMIGFDSDPNQKSEYHVDYHMFNEEHDVERGLGANFLDKSTCLKA